MNKYFTKLRVILPTFLMLVFGSIMGLALIRWCFSIQSNMLDIKEDVWQLWIPLIFPWIPITLWFRQKLRILVFKDSYRGRFFFQMIAWGTMCASLMISQSYLVTASGKLENLETITDIESREMERYYMVSRFQVLPALGGTYTDFRASGKHNQNLNFKVYFVLPIVEDAAQLQSNSRLKNWYGVKYQKQISNRLSSSEKQRLYELFYEECVTKMNQYDFHALNYFERTPNSDDRDNFLKAVQASIGQLPIQEVVVLEPQTEPFESRNGNKFAWIFGSIGIGLAIMLFSLIWGRYSAHEHQKLAKGIKPKQDDVVNMLKFLIPKGDHFATSVILNINIAVYLIMIFAGVHLLYPTGVELLDWGAHRRAEVLEGDWWRLLTSMFVHGGVMHLILNIVGLVLAALFLEPKLGPKNYFILYLLSGIAGSLASIWWYDHTVSVGASGAIFGLYGAVLSLIFTSTIPSGERRFLLLIIGGYVGLNLLLGLTGGIDNAAHIGGLLSGALLGMLLNRPRSTKKQLYKKENRSRRFV